MLFLVLFLFLCGMKASAQFVQGTISDAATGETLPGARVYYQDDKRTLVASNVNGYYKIAFKKGDLVVTMIGYEPKVVHVTASQKLNIKLVETVSSLKAVEVVTQRKKYSRKNNPAVTMMEKVIASKKQSDLREHDFLSFMKYEKMVMAMNEVTEKVFDDDHFKHLPFLKDHVETCPETGKLILPLTVDEKVSRVIYRKSPKTEKTIVVGDRSEGVTDLINTGDIVTGLMADCFTDVDIYKDEVRLLQFPFISPISNSAIKFYRYFIADTVQVDNQKCYRLEFGPNNSQDFGFSGSLWILADSTWQVKRVQLGIPSRSDVNFVEQMDIVQEFEPLPTGEQVVTNSRMVLQLKLASWLNKFQVERTVRYTGYDFSLIPERTFKFLGDTKVESSAKMRDEEFWEEQRPAPLTHSESQMNVFMKRLESIKGFKEILWVAKAFIENYVETSINPKHPSKVDIGPINAMFSQNFVEGFKLRASALTTANLSKHWFAKGYVGYGFGDKRWKGSAELTYSVNPKDYLPREFPKNNITASYYYDVIAPSDRFIHTDKDNVFTSLKWTKVDHMNYIQRFQLAYDREWENGLHLLAQFRRERSEGAGKLFFQPMNGTDTPIDYSGFTDEASGNVKYMTSSHFSLGIEYQPGVTWINTKQRRLKTNFDSPLWGISHTTGIKGLLGGEYNYNLTEISIYKRFWMKTWGKFDVYMNAQCQWNKAPYPMLCFPLANMSYIIQEYTFNLIDNMEFITDRNASLMLSWDMNGKLFNRIPLLKKLKLREFLGCNLYWGYLSDKNNPYLEKNYGDKSLMYFPGHFGRDGVTFYDNTQRLDPKKPYVELIAGIHNIFKLFHVEYVHRVNYLRKDTQKWGIRFTFRTTF